MISSLFKPLKMLDLYDSNVVSLLHQTSDKKLLGRNGVGIKFLTEFKT
jgi:ACT domain-containing protein